MAKYLEQKLKRQHGTEENKMQGGSLPEQAAPSQLTPNLLARQLGVKLEDVKGTGESGEVSLKDVRAHAKKLREDAQKNPPVSTIRPASR